MATSQPNKVIEQLCQTMLPRAEPGMTDGQLLERFVAHRDRAALEDLVRRHSSMVFGVCRRVLSHHQDAEDAFQATFLVLVRKAASVVPRELVANWLYGVAYQTARRAKVATAKRRMREAPMTVVPEHDVAGPDCWKDLEPVLDLELSHLPDKYRVPIVLCELEGKTHKEVARQIGCPIGTLSGRLSRGRKLLARRLARHGLPQSAGPLAAVLSHQAASATAPPTLVMATIETASILAGGQAAAAAAIPAKVANLMEEVLKAMFLTKLKLAGGILVATVTLGVGIAASGLLFPAQAAEHPDTGKETSTKGQSEARTPTEKPGAVDGKDGPRDIGALDERKLTRITARVDGTVEKIYKATSERVKKGEAVAELHCPDVTVVAQEFLDADRKGNRELLQATRERLRLWGVADDLISQMLLSGKPISRLTVSSPVDGVVLRTHRIRGDQVKAGDPLYDIADVAAADPGKKPARDGGVEPPKVQALLKERLATLQALLNATKAGYEAGKITFAEVAQANEMVLKAELELCESDKERLAVYERAVALAKDYEQVVGQRYKAGQSTHASVLAATASRLDAEINYERTKARVKPAPK